MSFAFIDRDRLAELYKLNEVFDKPYGWTWTRAPRGEGDQGTFRARFKTETGEGFIITLDTFRGVTSISFEPEGVGSGERWDITGRGRGEQFRIFATVLEVVKRFIEVVQPRQLRFSAKEKNRQKLYRTITRRYARQAGYAWEEDRPGWFTVTIPEPAVALAASAPREGTLTERVKPGLRAVRGEVFYRANKTKLAMGAKVHTWGIGSQHSEHKEWLEGVFERVRKRVNPNAPSRLGSVMLCPTLEGFCRGYMGQSAAGGKYLYAVRATGKAFTTNAEMWTEAALKSEPRPWDKKDEPFDPERAEPWAEDYWRGGISGAGFNETLLAGEAVVVARLDRSTGEVIEGSLTEGEYDIYTNPSGEKFWGAAGAGVLPIAKDTGRILVGLRSQYVNEPGTWGVFGGKIDENENPATAAKREMREELGFRGTVTLIKGHQFTSKGGGFRFTNFVGVVDEEFAPKLNWETEKAQWVTWADLHKLRPMHFGLEAFLKNSRNLIQRYAKEPKSESLDKTQLHELRIHQDPDDSWDAASHIRGWFDAIKKKGRSVHKYPLSFGINPKQKGYLGFNSPDSHVYTQFDIKGLGGVDVDVLDQSVDISRQSYTDPDVRKVLVALLTILPEIASWPVVGFRRGKHHGEVPTVRDLVSKKAKSTASARKLPRLFHGTSSIYAPEILRKGLRPRKDTGLKTAYGVHKPSREALVYLTDAQGTAREAAHAVASKKGGWPVVIEVRVPDHNLLRPDEDAEKWYGDDWWRSLTKYSTVAYEGRIPGSHIKPLEWAAPEKTGETRLGNWRRWDGKVPAEGMVVDVERQRAFGVAVESLTEGSYVLSDIPDYFRVAFDLGSSNESDRPDTALAWKSLALGKLIGIRGVSDTGAIEPQWLGIARNAVLVMPGKALVAANKVTRIMYDNIHYLLSNDMAAMKRIVQATTYNADEARVHAARVMLDYLAAMIKKHGGKETANIRYQWEYSGLGQTFSMRFKTIGKVNTVRDFIHAMQTIVKNERKRNDYADRMADDMLAWDHAEWSKWLKLVAETIQKVYGGEGEWVVKGDALKIPKGSTLRVLTGQESSDVPDKVWREYVAKYGFSGEEPKMFEDPPEWDRYGSALQERGYVLGRMKALGIADKYKIEFLSRREFNKARMDYYDTRDYTPPAGKPVSAFESRSPLRETYSDGSYMLWHVTSKATANKILSARTFKAAPTQKGKGLSFSVSAAAARGLLASAQRMFSFKTKGEVADWFVEMGAPREQVEKIAANYESWAPAWRDNPGGLYLTLMGHLHPAVGGPAGKIPASEFLWADIGKNLLQQGGPVVALSIWLGPNFPDEDFSPATRTALRARFGAGAIEAEAFVPERDLAVLNGGLDWDDVEVDAQPNQVRESITESMANVLFHTTRAKNVPAIAKSKKLLPGKVGCCRFVSLSEKPVTELDYGRVVLVFDRSKLGRRVEKVEYTQRWANKNKKKASYISEVPLEAGEPRYQPWDELVDEFTGMAKEQEWITSREGAALAFKKGDLIAVLCWECKDADLAPVRKAFAKLVPPERVTTLREGLAAIKAGWPGRTEKPEPVAAPADPMRELIRRHGAAGARRLLGLESVSEARPGQFFEPAGSKPPKRPLAALSVSELQAILMRDHGEHFLSVLRLRSKRELIDRIKAHRSGRRAAP